MQTANIIVDVGGDAGNQVPKYGVSAAEIAVLMAIHGANGSIGVRDIEPTDSKDTITIDGNVVKWTNRVELDRLRRLYSGAKDNENHSIVDTLFPGSAARVFETLDELNLPEDSFKPTSRATLKADPLDHDKNGEKGGAAPTQAEGLAALTVPQLKELAAKNNIDLGDATKKADIIAALEEAAALAAEEDEEVPEPVITPPPAQPDETNLFT